MSDPIDWRGVGAELARALALLPPGRTLAGEYLRLCSYIGELQRQVVRGTELRIAAEQRAGKRNVGRLEERIERLGATVRSLLRRSVSQRAREAVLADMGWDLTWYTNDVLLDEIDEDP